jgi:KUP system potassium uptake protein
MRPMATAAAVGPTRSRRTAGVASAAKSNEVRPYALQAIGGRPRPIGAVETDQVTDTEAVPAPAEPAGPPPSTDRHAHPAAHSGGLIGLALGALGIVFGDIGTSPLYAVQTVFSIDDGAVKPTPSDVYGVVSLIFWSITVVVTVKYVSFILRADNDGEGGIMALAALVRGVARRRARRIGIALALGVLGASLFYGDSLITPAISVLSAVEGLEIARPELAGSDRISAA